MKKPWNRALWTGVAVLCYLAGGFAFLAVVDAAGPVGSSPGWESLTVGDYATLLASAGLFFAGGYLLRRVRRPAQPDRTSLPSQFRRGQGPSRPDPGQVREAAGEPTGADVVRCPDCDAVNDTGFTYCGNCSSELPR